MPYAKRHTRKRASAARRPRRSYRKRVTRPRTTLRFKRKGGPASPFPPNLFTTFTWSTNFTLTQGTTDIPDSYVFRLNSLWDPDQTGVGAKPRYMDTLLGANDTDAPYRQYRVHSAKITATFWPTAVGVQQSGYAAVGVRNGGTSPSSLKEMRERPYYKCKPIYPTATARPIKISNYVKVKNLLGNKDLADNEDTLANYNANPAALINGDVSICNVGSSTTQQFVEIQIKYYAQLITLNDVTDS